ncbi:unnamed protein product [Microthlaspi erraticum]|uniref:Uncharacterized protein n=1 Tax=Microthlaspi erraticum TaxID=1685480 RepID=A0A6D2L9H9_9BRAS|nr:unnamed protein product [Microthlaspi erraticum]
MKRRLDKASGESKSSAMRPPLRNFDSYDDECIRQYILYYYQFQRSEGFVIDWDKLEYRFETLPMIDPYRAGERTNDEIIRDVACRAILQINAEKGTRLSFLDHVSASYRWCAEIAAVHVDPPPPLNANTPEFPTILFTVTGPGSGSIPDVVFTRFPPEKAMSSPESSP